MVHVNISNSNNNFEALCLSINCIFVYIYTVYCVCYTQEFNAKIVKGNLVERKDYGFDITSFCTKERQTTKIS